MDNEWSADITNDPQNDYDLCIEISQGDEHRATVKRDEEGTLLLMIYSEPDPLCVPVTWLKGILEKAENELPNGR